MLAAQHFKSAKSIQWLTSLLSPTSRFTWIETVAWDFGAPSHGKGPWDGIAGTMKRHLRTCSQRREARHESKLHVMHTPSGDINTPEDVFLQLYGDFDVEGMKKKEEEAAEAATVATAVGKGDEEMEDDTGEQGEAQEEKWWKHTRKKKVGGAVIDEFHIRFAGEKDIKRPKHNQKCDFESIVGIKTHYQFFGMRCNNVLKRRFSCWCPACTKAFVDGPCSRDTLHRHYTITNRHVDYTKDKKGNAENLAKWKYFYNIDGCVRNNLATSTNAFRLNAEGTCCHSKSEGTTSFKTHNQAVVDGGRDIKSSVRPGAFCLLENKPPDDMWLCKVQSVEEVEAPSKRAKKKKASRDGTVFRPGDTKVVVKFLERVADDAPGTQLRFVWMVNGLPCCEAEVSESEVHLDEVRAAGFQLRESADGFSEKVYDLDEVTEAVALSRCR